MKLTPYVHLVGGWHQRLPVCLFVFDPSKPQKEEKLDFFWQRSSRRFLAAAMWLHAQQMLLFIVLAVNLSVCSFSLTTIPVGVFTAHPWSVNALLNPLGYARHPQRNVGWVKCLTRCVVTALLHLAMKASSRATWALLNSRQQRRVFELVPANVTNPWQESHKDPAAELNYLGNQ